MFSLAPFAYAPAEEKYARLVKLQGADERIKRGLGELIGGLRAFGGRYYESYYSRVRAVTVGDMDIFVREAENRDLLSAAGADLVLSGHTHNGQLFPGTLVVRMGWENPYGLVRVGNMTSCVTQGAGVWGPAMRVGTQNEIMLLTLEFAGER